MLNKAQPNRPLTKSYQDYDYADGADYYYAESYKDEGYGDMVPEDEFVMDEEQASPPLGLEDVRNEIRRLVQLAEQNGADSKVMDAIRTIAEQVNFSSSLPGDRRAEALGQAMGDLFNLEIDIQSAHTEGPSEQKDDQGRKQEIREKIAQLEAKIEDPQFFEYALERDDLREKLEKAKASLDLGDLDSAEMSTMEIESAIQSHEAEKKSEALEGMSEVESTVETVKAYLQANVLEKFSFATEQGTLDQLDAILTRMRDGEISHEEAEAEAKQAVQALEEAILKNCPEMVRANLEASFGDLWVKATTV
ncbi:MAG: hypothetical protein K8R69_02285 [Deltaproteobacteria bacterium]|nr:hypothetical protein [Deltaproteobacteria bacterium]